jgi:hypothetical protein
MVLLKTNALKGSLMPVLILVAIILWFLVGDPPKTIANVFWPRDAAPWETVDAFYYPHRNDLSNYQMISGLKSVDDCRAMIQSIARTYNDGSRTTGAYECAIEIVDSIQGENVYRTTTR